MERDVLLWVCHQGEMADGQLAAFENLSPLHLGEISLPDPYSRFGGRIAEVRGFAQPVPDTTTHVGFVSWRMREKRGDGLTWQRVSDFIGALDPSAGFAPYLWKQPVDELEGQCDANFPGMGTLVRRLRDEFPPQTNQTRQVLGNSFFVPRAEFEHLRTFTEQILTWTTWQREEPPFMFRDRHSGEVNATGFGRYTSSRDVGFFLEMSTIYYFATQTDMSIETIPVSRSRRLAIRGAALFKGAR